MNNIAFLSETQCYIASFTHRQIRHFNNVYTVSSFGTIKYLFCRLGQILLFQQNKWHNIATPSIDWLL